MKCEAYWDVITFAYCCLLLPPFHVCSGGSTRRRARPTGASARSSTSATPLSSSSSPSESPLPASRPHSSARSAEQGEGQGQGQCGEDMGEDKREENGEMPSKKAKTYELNSADEEEDSSDDDDESHGAWGNSERIDFEDYI